MKAIAVLLISFLGFLVTADRLSTCVTDMDGKTVCEFESYCVSAMEKTDKMWVLHLTNGKTVRFTTNTKLKVEKDKFCE